MKLYNTLTRQINELTPLSGNTVKIYTCGLTVYSHPHIGNWTGYIYWDVLVRALRLEGYHVIRTQNITDVGHLVSDNDDGEDKMEKGARREGITAWDVAEKYTTIADHEAYGLLRLIRPDHLVRATDYIPQQIAFAKILEEKGFTYMIPNEGLYFDTSKRADYGKLAQLDIEGLEAGARVPMSGKRNITDFAIWKLSPPNQKRDMEWDSPWGKGFPGWHLECSVIARETLGDQIDIHTGGVDHIPVHHTNEIAQTESVTGKPFAQIWVHNNHIKVNGSKMAKSLGNIYTLEDVRSKGFLVEALKLMVLSKHYRTEGNFSWEILEAAQNRLRVYQEMADRRWQPTVHGLNDVAVFTKELPQALLAAASNDLDTPKILSHMSRLETLTSKGVHPDSQQAFTQLLAMIDELLGLHLLETHDITATEKQMIAEREHVREEKDWQKSDELRIRIAEAGIGLRDSAHGPIWYRL